MAATYTPQSDVEYAHAIPRFTTAGGMNENTDFNFTSISEMTDFSGFGSDDYFTGVMVLPVVLIACGVVALFFYNFLIMCRCCLHCLRCAPSEEDINEHPEKVVKSRNRVIFFFGFFVLLTILADHLLYYGNAQLDTGADDIISGGDQLNDIFADLSNSLSWASANATLVQPMLTTSQCITQLGTNNLYTDIVSGTSALSAGLDTLSGAMDSLSDMIDTLPPQVDALTEAVDTYMKGYKTIVLFGCYAVVIAFMILYMIAVFLQSSFIITFTIILSEVVVFVLTLLCGIMMIIVTVLADICMAPTEKFANLVPDTLKDVILFIGTCETTNPYSASIATAAGACTSISAAIGAVRDACMVVTNSGAGYDFSSEYGDWTTAGNNTIAIGESISKLDDDIDCLALNGVYDSLIHDALCTNMFGGLYKFWITEYLVSGGLFFTMIMASVIIMYFGTAWKLKKTDAHTHADAKDDAEVVQYEGVEEQDEAGYKEEYTFTPAGPGGSDAHHHRGLSKLNQSEVEMI